MKIALMGYGKMGKEIEKIALERGHSISIRLTSSNSHLRQTPEFLQSDVVVEFTRPESAPDNIMFCIDHHIPVVTGTTGWYEHLDNIKEYCQKKSSALLYASNFSLGVNLFFALNRYLTRWMSNFNEYECHIKEIHHTQKLDKPSGTALSLIKDILELHPVYDTWNWEKNNSHTLVVESIREGQVPGIHEITYSSTVDSIQIRHQAFNRRGFAWGAVMAAEWLKDKQGVFTMNDLLSIRE